MKRLSNDEKYVLEIMQFDEFLSCIGECECKNAKDLAKQIAINRNNRRFDDRRFDDMRVETKQTTINFKF